MEDHPDNFNPARHWRYALSKGILVVVAFIFLCLFRFAGSLMPVYFIPPFNLYLDSQFFPGLIFLLYSTLPLWILLEEFS